MKENKLLYLWVITLFSALGGLLFGYDTGVISGAILFIRHDFLLDSSMIEIVISSVLLGAIIGSSLAGVLSDRLGRRQLLLIVAILFILSSLGSAWSANVYELIMSRLFVGVAIGVSSMTTPLYLAEISPASKRGMLVSLNQLAITIGIVGSYLVDYLLADAGAWRWMLGLGAVPGLLLGLGMLYLPESPRWLVKHGKTAQARQILTSIQESHEAETEIQEIEQSLQSTETTLRAGLTPWLKRALIIGIGLAFFQQMTGINTVIYYAPMIFEFAGFQTASSAILATSVIGIVNVLATCGSLWLLDRLGRRPLLLTGIAGMVLSLGLLGSSFYFSFPPDQVAWITLASLIFYVISFAISLGPIFWLLIAEIYPLSVRGKAMSLATIVNWLTNLLVALTFLKLISLLGTAGTFWFYGAVGIVSWIFSYCLIPETKKLTLEEIESQMNRKLKKGQL